MAKAVEPFRGVRVGGGGSVNIHVVRIHVVRAGGVCVGGPDYGRVGVGRFGGRGRGLANFSRRFAPPIEERSAGLGRRIFRAGRRVGGSGGQAPADRGGGR